jgi:hypothetical protein
MATFAYHVYISWTSDEEYTQLGEMMEKTVCAVFAGTDDEAPKKDIDAKLVKKLRSQISARMYKKIPITGEFSEHKLFGDFEEPHTMYLQWENNRNDPYTCFNPLFEHETFSDLVFLLQCQCDDNSSDSTYRYGCRVYYGGDEDYASDDVFDPSDYKNSQQKALEAYNARCKKAGTERKRWKEGKPDALP